VRTQRAGAIVAIALAASACATTPRADRDWYPYLANTAHVETDGERMTIAPVSDWRYDAAGETAQCYRETSFDVDELVDVWFVLEPRPGSRLAAHTLLLFELTDDRLIGVTIEARREREETYSAWRGLWNAYELSYLWGTGQDLLTRRAVMLDHHVYVYPLLLDTPQKRGLLNRMVVRTRELERQPRFYNTFTSNCTNELAKAAGLTWNRAFVLTGLSDEYLFREGFIPGESFEAALARADVTELIRSLNEAGDAVDFDAALLAELRARRAESLPADLRGLFETR
jgi:hypothetical protein